MSLVTSPVFVDEPFVWPARNAQAHRVGARHRHQWCHMWSDDVEALHAMARKIGMKRAWFQAKPGFPHYDLVPTRRAAAIRAGAIEKPLIDWIREKRQLPPLTSNPITNNIPMQTKLLLGILLLVTCHSSLVTADDKVVRDSNGKIIERRSETANGRTVRDANGQVLERREKAAGAVIVRDGNGKIIQRSEDRNRRPESSAPRK